MPKVFIATVRVALCVEDAGSALSWMSDRMTSQMKKFNPGDVLDWRYVHRDAFAHAWVEKDVPSDFVANYEEDAIFEHDQYGDLGRHYLVAVEGDIEPGVVSVHTSRREVLEAARAYRKENGDNGGVYYLSFNANDDPVLDAFSGNEMDLSRSLDEICGTNPPTPEVKNRTMCKHCEHFVEENFFGDAEVTVVSPTTVLVQRYSHRPLARYVHLENGEQEFDHNAEPGEVRSEEDWHQYRPDLFMTYPDGNVGPNSRYHSRRGKRPSQTE